MTTGITSALGAGPIRSKNKIGSFIVSKSNYDGSITTRFAQTPSQSSVENIGVSISPKGSGPFSIQAPDGTITNGNTRGSTSVDFQMLRSSATQVASGTNTFVAGSYNYGGPGGNAIALGSNNTGGISTSVAIGNSCFCAQNSFTNTYAFGYKATSIWFYTTSFQLSYANRVGELCHGGPSFTGNNGDIQHGWYGSSNVTSNSTITELLIDRSNPSYKPYIEQGSRWKCTVEIMATTTGVINKSASWEYKLEIDRPTSVASTIIRSTPLLILSDGSNSGAPPAGWSVAITADTTNGSLGIFVTGDSNSIYWVGLVRYVQLKRV